MLSQSGPTFSPRYRWIPTQRRNGIGADILDLQALEGKDVKDLLLNVGSGGGAAAAAPSGGAAGGEAAAEETKEEEKEEGTESHKSPEFKIKRLTYCVAKEESDEDMGFGLFD